MRPRLLSSRWLGCQVLVGQLLAAQVAAGALNNGRRLQAGGAGLLVLTDPALDRVVIFDVNGDRPRKLTAFGVPGVKPGQFESPHGAGLNAFREPFVADSMNQRIQVFDLSPVAMGREPRLIRVWGTQGKGPGELDTPAYGVAIPNRSDPAQLVYVADTGNDRVQVFDRAGRPTGLTIGGRGSEDGRLDRPGGMAFDPAGILLYVVDGGNRRVSAFDAKSGRFLFKFGHRGSGEGELVGPSDLAVDSAGVVFVADPGSRRILRFKPEADRDGAVGGLRYEGAWAFVGDKPGFWTHPHSIAIDGKDRVYVVDMADGRCQAFSREGKFIASFDSDLDLSTSAPDDAGSSATLPVSVCSNGKTYELRLRSTPAPVPHNRLFEMQVEVLEGCSDPRPAADATLAVEAVMPEHRHGMNTEPEVQRVGNGRFRILGMLLHMTGLWELHFDVARGKVMERAQVSVVAE